jgi:quercetin dioxygenase-like cupin family protein
VSRHRVLRAADVRFSEWYPGHAEVATRWSLVDGARGSVHMGLGLCALAAGGRIDVHVQSFEESFFVLEGTPTLVLEDGAHRLPPGACGLVPVGAPHAWLGPESGVAHWIEMLAPQPREQGQADTFFLGWLPVEPIRDLDVRDPRMRHLFRLDEGQMDVDVVKSGARVDSPTVSASMATALLAYSGIAVKILVDQRLGAQLSTMFMVEYQPGGVAHLHDHPFEEAYVLLEGRVEATADGTRYVLEAGDVFWTGVGCVHGFENTSDRTVRWLETQAPQPPARHSYRFNRDWDYLQDALR